MGASDAAFSEVPREVLRDIVSRYGRDVVEDRRLCRALLLDFAGQYRREISVLIAAQEEQVADDLEDIPDSVPLSVRIAQLARRLIDNRALSSQAAQWAVLSWAYALGKPIAEFDPVGQASEVAPGSRVLALPDSGVSSGGQDGSKGDSSAATSSPTAVRAVLASDSGVYISQLSSEVYGRPASTPDAEWGLLGKTPGRIGIPDNYDLKIRLAFGGDQITEWADALGMPQRVIDLEVAGPCTDEGLRALGVLSRLHALRLTSAEHLTDQGVGALTAFRLLELLSISWCLNVTDKGFLSLATLRSLTSLGLSRASISDVGLAGLGNLFMLTHLTLRDCHWFSGTGFSSLSSPSRLLVVELAGGASVSDVGLVSLGKLTSVRKIDLSRCFKVTGQGLAHLAGLRSLDYLDLSWNPQIDDRALKVISGFSTLSTLNLSHTTITAAGLRYLESLKSLVYLDLSGCEMITDRALSVVREMPRLSYLNVTGCSRVPRRAISTLNRPGLYIAH